MDLTHLLDFDEILIHFVQLALAFLLALPIGWERQRHSENALGFRTVPLVAMTTCAFVILGRVVLDGSQSEARVLQGVITGIGFLGGGAIVKQGTDVHGIATAASIWAMAALGVATAYDRLEIAFAISLATFFLLRGLSPMRKEIDNVENGDEENG